MCIGTASACSHTQTISVRTLDMLFIECSLVVLELVIVDFNKLVEDVAFLHVSRCRNIEGGAYVRCDNKLDR